MIDFAANMALIILLISILITSVRLIRGPSLPDRIAALDLIAYISMGFIILLAIKSNREIYLDAVLVASLIIFLGAVTISLYLKKRKYDK